MKLNAVILALLLAVAFVSAQQIKIDDDNRFQVAEMTKGSVVTFTFYGDSFTLELGGFDFEHNRVTVEMHPQLGTDIVNLNVATNWDLDIDGEDDIGITVISLDPNKGANVHGEPGTAGIRLESLKPISLEKTTITTSVAATTSIEESTVGGAAVAATSLTGGSTIWIIAGIAVGVIVILFLLKDKIKGMFSKSVGEGAGQQQGTPANYKPAGKPSGSMMKCQKCGKEMPPGTRFCNNCGAKAVDKKKFCPECGTEFKGGKFCQNCGHKMV